MTYLNSQNKKHSSRGTSKPRKLVPPPSFEPTLDRKSPKPASKFGLKKKIIAIAIAFNIGLVNNYKAIAETVEVSGGGTCQGDITPPRS